MVQGYNGGHGERRDGNMFPDELLITINGYGYYDMSLTPVQTAKLMLAMPRIIAIFLPLLRTSEQRWQKSRSRYAEVVNRWQTTDLATTSAADLLNGACAITAEAAQYYLSVQSGILPGAYMSESLFTLVYNRFLKRRNAPSALTFVLGFDSAPIQAEKSLYDLAQWVRGQPELAAALANMSSEQFTTAYQAEQMAGVDERHGPNSGNVWLITWPVSDTPSTTSISPKPYLPMTRRRCWKRSSSS